MVPDSSYVCLLPTGSDFLQSWVKNIIASSPQIGIDSSAREFSYPSFSSHDQYITDFLIGEKDLWQWIPQVAATAFVEFKIAVDMYVERVYVYDAYSSVGYSDISLRDPAGDWVAVWSGLQVPQTQGDRIFSPELKKTNFKTSAVRLDIILEGVKAYVDAVKVVGENNLRLRA